MTARLIAASLFTLLLSLPAFALRERTVRYWGYVYGSDGDYCTCRISPCTIGDVLGAGSHGSPQRSPKTASTYVKQPSVMPQDDVVPSQ